MADLKLERPQTGQSVSLSASEDANIVFGFSIDEAIMSREEGSQGLTFSFDDGSSVVIENFYDTYTSDNMPDFIIEDQVIDGTTFFASFDENLMPAAGPADATAPSVADTGELSDFGSDGLVEGMDSLGTRDSGFNISTATNATETIEGGAILNNNSEAFVATGPVVGDNAGAGDNTGGEAGAGGGGAEAGAGGGGAEAGGGGAGGGEAEAPKTTASTSVKVKKVDGDSENVGTDKFDDVTSDFTEVFNIGDSLGFNDHSSLGKQSITFGNDGEESNDIDKISFTMSSVKVTTGDDDSITTESYGELGIRNNASDWKAEGITVLTKSEGNLGPDWDNEISSRKGESVSEGIRFEMNNDEPAYNLTLELSSFYVRDGEEEEAIVYLYKGVDDDGNPVLVDTIELKATSHDGDYTFNAYIPDGFDDVVIKPSNTNADTDWASSFLVKSVAFGGEPENAVMPSYFGEIEVEGGTGNDNSFAFAPLEEIDSVNASTTEKGEDGSITTIGGIDSDQGIIVVTTVAKVDGSSTMSGVDEYGNATFEATLNGEGEWTFDSFKDITTNNGEDFKLDFVVTVDGEVLEDLTTATFDATGGVKGDVEDNALVDTDADASSLDDEGNEGNDNLFGDESDDNIFGGEGSDNIYGGEGNDTINGGEGADKLYGGDGDDIIKFETTDIFVDGGDGTDFAIGGTIEGILANLDNNTIEGVEMFLTGAGAENLGNEEGVVSINDLASIGINKQDDGSFELDKDEWTETDSEKAVIGKGEDAVTYVEMTHGSSDETITALVNQTMLENFNS